MNIFEYHINMNQMNDLPIKELSTRQAAEKTDVSHATIINHIKRNNLKARKRLGAYKIDSSDLEAWAISQGLTIS